ncbi:TfuA-like protein [Microvirga puerhi]|uniref:TfuA-like core domain-containing protein n=1 Tax=Microvirga puerhi TaxID=2876078 RepID=A0ABS7VMP5_9HYPH|nr:TfuA-like protein [Microvirga puerhi]MBZ6076791.1 hypothetical protein [Microvirga puerhi]
MDERVVVFLGPTLPQKQARDLLDAHYLPPVEQGHIIQVVQSLQPRKIVIVDGAFGSVPTVRHKEILWALGRGISIYGAGSLGALRAAELAGFGMKGHGLIYRWYRSTPYAEDDEVAVAMAPPELGAAALGDALIDMRITFRRAARAGIVSEELRDRLVEIARSIHFLERSYSQTLSCAMVGVDAQEASCLRDLDEWLHHHAFSQKRADAASLLRCLATATDGSLNETINVPTFRLTEALVRDLEESGLNVGDLEAQKE